MSDNDSFEIGSDFENSVNDILHNDSINDGGSNLLNNIKYWFYRNRLYFQNSFNSTKRSDDLRGRNERGIPLYDMDNNGDRLSSINDSGYEFDHSLFKNRTHFGFGGYILGKRLLLRFLSGLAIFITFIVLVSGSIRSNHPNILTPASFLTNLINEHQFDPFKQYTNGTHPFYPLTLMISIDGFHPALISKKNTPFLHSLYTLQKEGYNITSTPYMIPSFPAQTFPNHWSMVTGDYPIDHGIVSNLFHDSYLDMDFTPLNEDPLIWYNSSEPIWETVQRAFSKTDDKGKVIEYPFKVATHMWPGSTVNYTSLNKESDYNIPEERTPFYHDKYDSQETLDEKLSKILEYIDMDNISERPQMILSYIPQIDEFGHLHGYPISVRDGIEEEQTKDGKNFIKLLQQLDNFFEGLFNETRSRNIDKFTNILIVSDHGMSDIQVPENVVSYEELLSPATRKNLISRAVYEGPMLSLNVHKKENINSVYQELKKSLGDQILSPFFNIYLNGQFPEEFKYNADASDKNNDILGKRRGAPIWIVPEPGFAIMSENEIHKKKNSIVGSHGYNNTHIDMRSLFIGTGPYFNTGYIESFENVELYKLLCDISGIKMKDRNFSFREKKLLSSYSDEDEDEGVTYMKHIKDIFASQDYNELLLEDNFEYIAEKFGKWNTYNYIWGGTESWEEEYENEPRPANVTLSNDTNAIINSEISTTTSIATTDAINSTRPDILNSPISSSSMVSLDTAAIHHTTTILKPSSISEAPTEPSHVSFTNSLTTTTIDNNNSNSTSGANVINWLGNLIDDAKELIDNVVDEVTDLIAVELNGNSDANARL